MQTHTRIHRHFLALPVFVLCLAGVAASSRVTAQVSDASRHSAAAEIHADGGEKMFVTELARGALSEDGRVTVDDDGGFVLEEGSLLLDSPEDIRITAGDVHLRAFNGGLLAVRSTDRVTVHALTTPVLVRRGNYRIVVPIGVAFEALELPNEHDLSDVARRSGAFAPIPATLHADELTRLRVLDQIPSHDDAPAVFREFPDALLLPAARQQSMQEGRQAALGALEVALKSHVAPVARALMARQDIRDFLASDDGLSHLPHLLALSRDLPSAAEGLLEHLSDADLWLVLSFHPAHSLAAWGFAGPLSLPRSARELRWLQLPSSDVQDVVPPAVLRSWRQEMQIFLNHADDPGAFLAQLLTSLRSYRDRAEREELPERLGRTASAVRSVVGQYAGSLDEESQTLYGRWQGIDDIPEYVEPEEPMDEVLPTVDAPVAVPEPPPLTDPRALERQIRKRLEGAGALLTIQTEITAENSWRVAVRGLLIPGPSGDALYDFAIDPRMDRVTNIRTAEESFPFAMPLKDFAAWAKEE